MFHHPERNPVSSVHGNDVTTAGPKKHLDLFEAELARRYELSKGGRLGPGPTDDKEGLVLNRVIRLIDGGLEYKVDPRQEGTNTVATPGIKALLAQVAADKPLSANEHSSLQGKSARCNYLAANRPDCQFSATDILTLRTEHVPA